MTLGNLSDVSLDLRQQVGELIVAELPVFPVNFDPGTIFGYYFSHRPVRSPNNLFLKLERGSFLCVHGREHRPDPA